jgi:hypothetical protein
MLLESPIASASMRRRDLIGRQFKSMPTSLGHCSPNRFASLISRRDANSYGQCGEGTESHTPSFISRRRHAIVDARHFGTVPPIAASLTPANAVCNATMRTMVAVEARSTGTVPHALERRRCECASTSDAHSSTSMRCHELPTHCECRPDCGAAHN